VATVWVQQTWANNRVGLLCLFQGELGPHLLQCGLGRGLPQHQVASWSVQPFGQHRWTVNWVVVPLWAGGSWVCI